MLFRRLFATIMLLVAATFLVLVLGVGLSVEESRVRNRLLAVVGGAGAVAVLGALGLSVWLARYITRPLDELGQAVEGLGGAGGRRVFTDGEDEIGMLGDTVNRVGERLAARIGRLEEERQQLHTILSGMVEGVVALDAEQRILFANDRAAQLLEFPTPLPVNRRIWEVVRQRPLLDVVQRALRDPEPQRTELSWNGAAQRSLTVHAAALPVPAGPHAPGGGVRGIVLVLHDTSEIRRLERLRQEFVANVSHELKTPLSVVKACVDTLLDGAVEDPAHRGRFLEQIASQSDRLHALILDLLSLARLEAGDQVFDLRAVSVTDVVEACLDRQRTRADARQQTLSVQAPEEDLSVWADEEAVEQILENLLDNAVKYTPAGGRIGVTWRRAAGQVCLEVSDTGIGIPEADLPRVFERFYRVDKARSREMGGTGLGLSIVKHLTQALNGSVRAASRLGEGTTFIVCLPRAEPVAQEMARQQRDTAAAPEAHS
jgi:two-component system phosphate regulon sensor histidine kinase PhoR